MKKVVIELTEQGDSVNVETNFENVTLPEALGMLMMAAYSIVSVDTEDTTREDVYETVCRN